MGKKVKLNRKWNFENLWFMLIQLSCIPVCMLRNYKIYLFLLISLPVTEGNNTEVMSEIIFTFLPPFSALAPDFGSSFMNSVFPQFYHQILVLAVTTALPLLSLSNMKKLLWLFWKVPRCVLHGFLGFFMV